MPRFNFSGFVTDLPFSSRERWAKFLTLLQNVADAVENIQQRVGSVAGNSKDITNNTTIVQNITNISGGADTIVVPNTAGASAGQLVYLRGSTLQIADCTGGTDGYPALWLCSETNGSDMTLTKVVAGADILKTGSGDDGTGYLYLYTGGGITLDKAQVMDADGYLVSGVKVFQIVGDLNSFATAASGFVSGSVYLWNVQR